MNYAIPISDMLWSYSRVSQFEDCKYAWYLKYLDHVHKESKFFSEYGSFMHDILKHYFKGELAKSQLVDFYLTHFSSDVRAKAMSHKVFSNYFEQGLEFLKELQEPDSDIQILGVEEKVNFHVDQYEFIGYIDLLIQKEGELILIDHKSGNLKPRSKRKTPTKTDLELDGKLRQLYMYSIPVKAKYGKFPKYLCFNTFRQQKIICEEFKEEALDNAIKWATSSIENIVAESEWEPSVDLFKCEHICDVNNECDYYKLAKGK